jgi:hypothetical protein
MRGNHICGNRVEGDGALRYIRGMPAQPETRAASPVVATDPTLIDAMLAFSPEERLRQNDRMLRTIQELRDGFAATEPHHPAGAAGGERR